MDIKALKKELKKKTDAAPEKYFPVNTLKEFGFSRYKCSCGRYFWSQPGSGNREAEGELCGDCEGYQFIGKPIGLQTDYPNVWKRFYKHLETKGYQMIPRYPVVARWRDDIDFTIAAISNFQPQITSGLIKPQANPLTVNQPSLRFNDIDNVGITGRHFTCHMHMEQFGVFAKELYDQAKYLSDIISWLTKGFHLPLREVKFHEDAWGGGGDMGTSLEFFSRGLELGNQVYMTYKITPTGLKELPLKVLDMGSGQERYSWLASGESQAYTMTMPTVCKRLFSITGVNPKNDVVKKFAPYSGALNLDEAENLEQAWKKISEQIGITIETIKKELAPLAAVYSIAEHTRALLFPLIDGALPSNTGGGYNLRSLYRRMSDFAREYGWEIDFVNLIEMHAKYLKPMFPELVDGLDEVQEILNVEERKYKEATQQASQYISQIKGVLTEDKMVELYDSRGISPELLKKEGVIQEVPPDFYSKVSALHEAKKAKVEEIQQFDVPETELMFYSDEYAKKFRAKVLKVINDRFVVLDRTLFYGTAGGQLFDKGEINGNLVLSVEKYGNWVVHELDRVNFKVGDEVEGEIDWRRRFQLMQNHTATHIVNGAAREVLGNHVWQNGAKKDVDKAHIDITHYDNLTDEQVKKIESRANEVVKKGIEIEKKFMPKGEAEQKYGFRLYQGGVAPGAELRVVNIKGFDVEACGGTHLDNTKEAKLIKILGTKKIQDGIVRIYFVAGDAAEKQIGNELNTYHTCLDLLGLKKDGKVDLLVAAANFLRVQPSQLPNTIRRFLGDLEKKGVKVKFAGGLVKACEELFELWKRERKK